MSFTVDDETDYRARRDQLSRDFAAWIARHGVEADPSDVELLLDWKWGYGDGELGHWRVPDIAEFLLEWCPRKLATPIDLCAEIPGSISAFFDFLAHRGLLATGSQAPSALRKYCSTIGPRFLREMRNPANFGMAKSLFAGVEADQLSDELCRLTGVDPGQLAQLLGDEPELIGPVRLPTPAERLESLRAAVTFTRVRGLAERCAGPGLAVTSAGNLRLADARRLVVELRTGDDAEPGGRPVRSATELPALSWIVELAVAAGAATVAGGRLTADSEFTELPDPDAHLRLVTAAIELGLAPRAAADRSATEELLDDGGPHLLSELLHGHAERREVGVRDLIDLVRGVADAVLGDYCETTVDSGVQRRLDRLAELGVLTRQDGAGTVALTPAGVTVAAELVPELLGSEVVLRPDPLTADVTDLAAALLLTERAEAEADLGAWFAAQPEPGAAAAALLAELADPDTAPAEVLTGLDLAGAVLGERAETAARPHLTGPHELLVQTWLLTRGALDPEQVGAERVLSGMVAVAAAMIDVEGPEGAAQFCRDTDPGQVLELLEQLWRLDHPRVGDVLDGIGRHHPDRRIAKAARKNLMRHRSRLAQ